MKILYDNYLDDSTVVATSENSAYPVENLTHKFLEKKYMATANNTTITVTFPEDRTVSMLAYGFNNVDVTAADTIKVVYDATDSIKVVYDADDTVKLTIGSSYEFKDSSGNVVALGEVPEGEDVNVAFFDPVVARSLEISFTANDTLFIGGLAVGDPIEYEYHNVNPQVGIDYREGNDKTDGGQALGRRVTALREWSLVIPTITDDKRKATQEMIQAVGAFKPVYAAIYDDTTIEPAMYCTLGTIGTFTRDSRAKDYTMTLTLEEAR